ncbi:carboxymuconolactone decarboxylase family protein [Kitasatospora sp. NPDC059571]|uniref:carboxymuconolactone decarboxylase family protein n=1 Tax=Kitasatospora sp. NPDC059571 TaxID=3346871 RepID=UPI003683EE66
MNPRLNFYGNPVATKVAKYIKPAGARARGAGPPPAPPPPPLHPTGPRRRRDPRPPPPPPTQELVKIRASQINGCGFCLDMHTKDAAHAGETSLRLHLIAAWREATVFTDAERAALELTEQGTRIADAAGGVTDDAWENAAKYYDEDQLAALVSLIALINTYNRFNVIVQQPAGDYQPGQFG